MDQIRIFAPASISNVGPGFDLMGFALEKPGDVISLKKNNLKSIRIYNKSDMPIPVDPEKNVAAVAIHAFLKEFHLEQGIDLFFEQKIKPGSGIGSSAASACAAVFGANELMETMLPLAQLIPAALKGEFIASGSIHADNIAPSMLGGLILVRSYEPLDIIQIPIPESLYYVVVHPDIVIKTAESRKIIAEQLSLKKALEQCGNIAGLVTGFTTSDYELIGRSLKDVIAEPVRAPFIPGYLELKHKIEQTGALGASISGSGPSVFALCDDMETAVKVSELMQFFFERINIECETYLSKISPLGARVIHQ